MKENTKAWKVLIFMLGILMFDISVTEASPVTIQISGIVTEVTGSEPYSYTETIYAGTTFTGTYTYDSETIGSYQQPNRGIYFHSSPYGFNLSLGGFEFKTVEDHVSQFSIWLCNYPSYDEYRVESDKNTPLSTDLNVHGITWYLRDNTHATLSSIDLPSDAPNLNNWDTNVLFINCGGLGNDNPLFTIYGTVMQAVFVPEPATLLLLGLGSFLIRQKK